MHDVPSSVELGNQRFHSRQPAIGIANGVDEAAVIEVASIGEEVAQELALGATTKLEVDPGARLERSEQAFEGQVEELWHFFVERVVHECAHDVPEDNRLHPTALSLTSSDARSARP